VAKQQTFASLAWQNKGRQTRREQFLSEMDGIKHKEIHPASSCNGSTA